MLHTDPCSIVARSDAVDDRQASSCGVDITLLNMVNFATVSGEQHAHVTASCMQHAQMVAADSGNLTALANGSNGSPAAVEDRADADLSIRFSTNLSASLLAPCGEAVAADHVLVVQQFALCWLSCRDVFRTLAECSLLNLQESSYCVTVQRDTRDMLARRAAVLQMQCMHPQPYSTVQCSLTTLTITAGAPEGYLLVLHKLLARSPRFSIALNGPTVPPVFAARPARLSPLPLSLSGSTSTGKQAATLPIATEASLSTFQITGGSASIGKQVVKL